MIIIKGIPASPGIAIGKAYVYEDDIVVEKREIDPEEVKNEVKRFKDAVKKTHTDLDNTEAKVLLMLGQQHAKLIETHRFILKDPLITQEVPRHIQEEHVNAEYALSITLEKVNRSFEKIDDDFFRERRHDLFDVGKRLLRHLLEKHERRSLGSIKDPIILIAHNLYPSDTLHLREANVLGFCTNIGGKTSHTAILAQSMELPAVVGLSDVTKQVKNNEVVIVDGDQGIVIVSPGAETLEKYQKAKRKAHQEERFLETVKPLPSVTRDGKKINLVINIDGRDDPKAMLESNPDGVGLVRTESIYMNRTTIPGEDEQAGIYADILKTFAPNPVVIRLADIGGDKLTDLGIESHEKEDNPFMGLRGVRLFLRHPELMRTQLRAILRASVYGNARIMIPMVSSGAEVRGVKKALADSHAELLKEGVPLKENVPLGIMVEVPASAIILDTILSEIDFVSVGTNDLIQYLLAVDRINQNVAHLYDSYHPAVWRILNLIVQTAHKKGKTVSICGEMASDPKTAPALIGLGTDTLSITPRMFLRIKHSVRLLSFEKASLLAQKILSMSKCEEIRDTIAAASDENT